MIHIVTDEQSPIPATYSRIEARVVEALARDDGMEYGIVFNCQMGQSFALLARENDSE